jgi:DnaJ-class molecular chaperone
MDQEIYHVCQQCAGDGQYKDKPCIDCQGTGRVLFGFLIDKKQIVAPTKKAK